MYDLCPNRVCNLSPCYRGAADEVQNNDDYFLTHLCCLVGSEIIQVLSDRSWHFPANLTPIAHFLFFHSWSSSIQPTALLLRRSRGLTLVKSDSFISVMFLPSCV